MLPYLLGLYFIGGLINMETLLPPETIYVALAYVILFAQGFSSNV
ncbi:hypothetical protein VCHA48P442_20088 [Vibrio chagasii]|nr:hypothetical protein VCHA48P442_20079 [Vibrio chagasii]CAH7182061.1 hypothetical protein VCHA48P442_20088 [Vibrio chagasii]